MADFIYFLVAWVALAASRSGTGVGRTENSFLADSIYFLVAWIALTDVSDQT